MRNEELEMMEETVTGVGRWVDRCGGGGIWLKGVGNVERDLWVALGGLC